MLPEPLSIVYIDTETFIDTSESVALAKHLDKEQ